MKKIWNKIDRTLLEMMLGIVLWIVLWQIVGVWFVTDKFLSSLALWIGGLLAELSAVHMYYVLDRALSADERGAQKMVMCHSMIRYVVIVGVLVVTGITKTLNPLLVFLGIMGLKAAAYEQPFIHRFLRKEKNKE